MFSFKLKAILPNKKATAVSELNRKLNVIRIYEFQSSKDVLRNNCKPKYLSKKC